MMEKLFGMELELILLQALVMEKIIVTEASVRSDLQLNDKEGTDCLPNATIFKELTRMGYEKLSQKLTFYKAFFSYIGIALYIHFCNALRAKTMHKQRSRRLKREDNEIPQSSVPSDNVADEAVNEEMDGSLERATTTATGLDAEQDRESIDRRTHKMLKLRNYKFELRFKSLEMKGGSRNYKLKEYTSDLAGEEVFVAEQGVPDSKKDEAAQVNTVATTINIASTIPVSAASITDVEITLTQALAELKSAKPTTSTSTRPKAKGLVIHEQEQTSTLTVSSQQPSQAKIQDKAEEEKKQDLPKRERDQKEQEANVALIEEWNDIQAKIEVDQLLAERLQAREQEELTVEEMAKLFQQLLEKTRKFFAAKRELFEKEMKRVNTFIDMDTELVEGTKMEKSSKRAEKEQESSSKRAGDELEQKSAKKQKVDVEKETE
ncbi:hypothetical protein Tco_0285540 [Tanacetum coccineum]